MQPRTVDLYTARSNRWNSVPTLHLNNNTKKQGDKSTAHWYSSISNETWLKAPLVESISLNFARPRLTATKQGRGHISRQTNNLAFFSCRPRTWFHSIPSSGPHLELGPEGSSAQCSSVGCSPFSGVKRINWCRKCCSVL